jgi:5-(carboxyamino)imidazole ribonucleotide synthase
LYGKKETRPHRKMGHITIVDDELNHLRDKVEQVKKAIRVIA